MPISAANSAALRHVSLCVREQTNASFPIPNVGSDYRRSSGGHACSNRTAVSFDFRCPNVDENFVLKRVCRYVSRLMLDHRLGAIPAPGGTWSSASHYAPLRGLGSSQNKFAKYSKERPANFFRAPPRKQTFGTWEPGPLASFALRDPSNNGRIQQTGDTLMYQNKVTLIGFLGSNAEVRNNSNGSFTTLSLATKSSYKKNGEYVSHTEWHRCVVFGKLSEFAKTLTKGAHVQVEGELRSREYDSKKTDAKQRVWEVRVSSILKLDRAEKSAPEDQDHDDATQEETAA
jgi:single-strand DNA-binding protein